MFSHEIGGYRPSLDGVRAVAILLVMAEHARVRGVEAGGLGVDVFFVLSGFLITGLLTAERERSGGIAFRAFYLRRATRLYPALLVLVTVGGALVVLDAGAGVGAVAKAGAIAITYTTDLFTFGSSSTWALWGFTWSLAVEEHFYLLWPPVLLLLLMRCSRRTAACVTAAGGVAGVVTVVLLAVPGEAGPPGLYFQPQAHAGGLLLGCAAALVPRWPAWSRHLAAPSLLLLLLVVVASPSPVHEGYFRASLPVVWVLTAVLLVGLQAPSLAERVLGWNPLRLIGLVSYGLYLYHQVVFREVRDHLSASRPAVVVVGTALSLVVAALSYRFVETPIRRRGRRAAAALSARHAPLGAASAATSTPG